MPVAVADLTGDGNEDLIVGSLRSSAVDVLLANGNGTFQAMQTFATGPAPFFLAVGDVNGDGNPDLVVTNGSNACVSVLLGNGNGTFQAQQTIATASGQFSLALADLTGDGKLDIVATNSPTSSSLSVLLNNVNGNFTGQLYTVAAPATAHFAFSGMPFTTTAGSSFSFTLTALDPSNNTATGYTGTVHFSSTDTGSGVVLPADYTFVPADGGVHVFTASSILVTAGIQIITATDTVVSTDTASDVVVVSPAAASQLVVFTPSTIPTGTPFQFTVAATDQFGNTATSYGGTLHFASSDLQAVLPADATLTNGTGTFSATLMTLGNQTLAAADIVSGGLKIISPVIVVIPTGFAITTPSAITVANAFSMTVTALGANGTTATAYSGTAHFTSTDGQAILPADATLSNGVGIFNATFFTSGAQTITATDTTMPITGSIAVSVTPGAATHFVVVGPSTAVAGVAINFTVTAKDSFGNTATGYTGTVQLSTNPPSLVVPANKTLINGTGIFSVILDTAGTFTLSANDTVTTTIAGASGPISVSPAATAKFAVTANPTTITAGRTFTLTVTALDAFGNATPSYSGTLSFSFVNNRGISSGSSLTNGTQTFTITLLAAGIQTVTAYSGAISGTSNAITVTAGAAMLFSVSNPRFATAGSPFAFTVTAVDSFGNTATGYTGTVSFTTTNAVGSVAPNATLSSGIGIFSATLTTAGSAQLLATDTANANINGGSGLFTVIPGAASQFSVTLPPVVTTGIPFIFTVTALDSYGNTATGYTGTVSFTTTDALATPPANATLVSGTATLRATLKELGSQTLTATDTVNSGLIGTSNPSIVIAGPATHFTISGVPTSVTAGGSVIFSVTALDTFNNIATGYTGTVRFASTDALATLPPNATLSNGVGTFSITLKSAGDQTLSATDVSHANLTATSNAIAVSANSATHFAVAAPTVVNVTLAFQFTITALDQFGNTAAGYTGIVDFTSSDSHALLPANTTLSHGVGAFRRNFEHAGHADPDGHGQQQCRLYGQCRDEGGCSAHRRSRRRVDHPHQPSRPGHHRQQRQLYGRFQQSGDGR